MTRKKKSSKDVGMSLQVGSFVLSVKTNGVREYLVVKTISGNWKVVYYEDNIMFGRILTMMQEPEFEQYLSAYLFAQYALSNNLPDWDFLNVFAKEFSALFDRYGSKQEQSSDEDDDKALTELTTIAEMQDAIVEQDKTIGE